MNLDELARTTTGLDEADFRERYPHPALVFLSAAPIPDGAGFDTQILLDEDSFKVPGKGKFDATATDAVPVLDLAAIRGGRAPTEKKGASKLQPGARSPKDRRVWFVVKSTRNPFADMIMVGRATNNDLHLMPRTISKAHAYFSRSASGWQITDQHAANGTVVDGVRLPSSGSMAVGDGTPISFGPEVHTEFFTPRGLHMLLARVRSSMSSGTS